MDFLIDTNILVRLANAADPMNPIADGAILKLHRRGDTVHITAQNLVEFRNVATRPKALNGLGMLVAVCHVHNVTHLLTFNTSHFTALAAFGPGLVIVDPANV